MLRLGLLHRAAGCGLLLSKITNLLFLASTKKLKPIHLSTSLS
mgnify:CR=1 FL=1